MIIYRINTANQQDTWMKDFDNNVITIYQIYIAPYILCKQITLGSLHDQTI